MLRYNQQGWYTDSLSRSRVYHLALRRVTNNQIHTLNLERNERTHIGECSLSKTYAPINKRYLKNKTSRYKGYNPQMCNHHVHLRTTVCSAIYRNLDWRDKVLRCQCHRKLLSTVSLHLSVSVSQLRYLCLQVFGDSETLAHTFRWWVGTHSHTQVQELQNSLRLIPSDLCSWAMTPKPLVHHEQYLCRYRTQCLHIGLLEFIRALMTITIYHSREEHEMKKQSLNSCIHEETQIVILRL